MARLLLRGVPDPGRGRLGGGPGRRPICQGRAALVARGAARCEGRGGRGGRAAGRGGRAGHAALTAIAAANEWDENEILMLGLRLVGFEGSHDSLSIRRFRAFFGVGPKALACLFNDLPKESKDVTKFLMAVNWLKLYDTEHVLAARWGLHKNTLRPIVKEYSKLTQDMKATKVVWGGFNFKEIFIVSVDGIHCRIQEVRKEPGAKGYSHKSNGPGLSYELGIAIRSNRLVWISGPFEASKHDISIFRRDDAPNEGLKAHIPDGKRAIGDSGYRGEPTKVSITREDDSGEVKKFKARAKSRHETFNGRLKSFNVLATAFRHGYDEHQTVFEAACICVQYGLENGYGLFEM
jgi:DDE superfamily endonuclease